LDQKSWFDIVVPLNETAGNFLTLAQEISIPLLSTALKVLEILVKWEAPDVLLVRVRRQWTELSKNESGFRFFLQYPDKDIRNSVY